VSIDTISSTSNRPPIRSWPIQRSISPSGSGRWASKYRANATSACVTGNGTTVTSCSETSTPTPSSARALATNAADDSSPTVRAAPETWDSNRVVNPGPHPRSTATATGRGTAASRNDRVDGSKTDASSARRSPAISLSP
jgi:hypothetical protein